MKKDEIRTRIRELREAQPAELRERKDAQIMSRLQVQPVFEKSREFFTYLSHRGEVATDPIIKKFFGKKKIIVPKMENDGICLFELHDPEKFTAGRFGVREPIHCLRKTEWGSIDVALIPGIAFDASGHRIGFGGGFFDRLLAQLHCTTIGLAYEFQIIDKVPVDSYDVPVDFIVTEERFIHCHVSPSTTGS